MKESTMDMYLAGLSHAVNVVSADRSTRVGECKKAVKEVFADISRGEKVSEDRYLSVLTRLLLEVCRGDA